MVELQAPSRWWWPVIFRAKVFVSSAHTTIPHSLSEDGQLPTLDGAREPPAPSQGREHVDFLPLLGGRGLFGEESDGRAPPHVFSGGSPPGAPACREAAPGICAPYSQTSARAEFLRGVRTVAWGPGQPPSPGPGLASPGQASVPGAARGGWCGREEPPGAPGRLAVRPGRLRPGSWRNGARPG